MDDNDDGSDRGGWMDFWTWVLITVGLLGLASLGALAPLAQMLGM